MSSNYHGVDGGRVVVLRRKNAKLGKWNKITKSQRKDMQLKLLFR